MEWNVALGMAEPKPCRQKSGPDVIAGVVMLFPSHHAVALGIHGDFRTICTGNTGFDQFGDAPSFIVKSVSLISQVFPANFHLLHPWTGDYDLTIRIHVFKVPRINSRSTGDVFHPISVKRS